MAASVMRGHAMMGVAASGYGTLPGAYYARMVKWCAVVAERLKQSPQMSLKELEAQAGWYHFPYTVLPAAVLYAQNHQHNRGYKKPEYLALALEIGDLIVREDEGGTFAPRLDSYRDVSLWIDAYSLLEHQLGDERKRAWRASIERNVDVLVKELEAWKDVPRYTESFLGSSPNHFAWWAATTVGAGTRLGKPEWVELGSYVLRRFATTEQNVDGYWGEHNPNAPTGGYNYLTAMAVGLWYEYTRPPEALPALRRAADFHLHTTYPDGNLIELFNDRNRYWHVSYWGTFAFTHFADGRSYAALLAEKLSDDAIDLDALGLIAQNALYFHDGPTRLCPPLQKAYGYRLHAEAGVRKSGPWVAGLSGIVDTPLPRSQWFLERQANLSLFHEKVGSIIWGSHSKHQPELATFAEKLAGEWATTPKGSRLTMGDAQGVKGSRDSLALAYNSFQSVMVAYAASDREFHVDVAVSSRGPAPEEAWFGVQLNLADARRLRTAAGKDVEIGAANVVLNAKELGGGIEVGAWKLSWTGDAELTWPVYPYNPYRGGKETKLEHAVGMLRFPLRWSYDAKQWLHLDAVRVAMKVEVLA